MNIIETDKERMAILLKVILNQLDGVENVNIQLNEKFDLEPLIPHLLDKFPLAVDPALIADPDSEDDKITRANGILRVVIAEPITGRFLDFGCGEGHVVSQVFGAKVAVGYDILEQKWDNFKDLQPNMILTTSWDKVIENGPYDFILIYDVLDHMKDEEEVVSELKKIRVVMNDKGKIFIRLHPWCSRHGMHLYSSINKAFLHLCLSKESLEKMGYKPLHTIKIIHPLQTYAKWFNEAGLNIISSNIIPEEVEPFFKQSAIAAIIKRHWRTSYQEPLASGKEFPDYQLRQQFVDMVLEKL